MIRFINNQIFYPLKTSLNSFNFRFLIPVLLISAGILSSCEFKNEQELDLIPCDTNNVTYSTVEPIFENNCVRCHNEFTNYLDIKLSSYDNVVAAAQSGLLIKAVNHWPGKGIVFMPFQLPKLDSCSVHKITIWIRHNTPQ